VEIKEALDIMNSDFKLWEKSHTEDLGNGKVQKTIELPWGIGLYSIVMEGLTDGGKRRAAVGAYGEHIRSIIDERINDDAITSRAKVAAGRAEMATASAESDDSGDSVGVSGELGVRDTAVQTTAVPEAAEAHGQDDTDSIDFGDGLAASRIKVSARIDKLTAELAKLCKQLKGIDAAIAAMSDDE